MTVKGHTSTRILSLISSQSPLTTEIPQTSKLCLHAGENNSPATDPFPCTGPMEHCPAGAPFRLTMVAESYRAPGQKPPSTTLARRALDTNLHSVVITPPVLLEVTTPPRLPSRTTVLITFNLRPPPEIHTIMGPHRYPVVRPPTYPLPLNHRTSRACYHFPNVSVDPPILRKPTPNSILSRSRMWTT